MTSWTTRTLGEVATVGAGNSAPQDEALFASGSVPFFRTSDVGRIRFGDIDTATDLLNERGANGLRRFASGTILFPKSGASTFLNHRVMMQVDGCVSSHLATIAARRELAEPRFLLYFLATVQAQDLVQDHAYPSLNLPLIAGIEVPLPPLPEQRRVVAILDEAFEAIATAKANTEKNLQSAREVFTNHVKSVFANPPHGWVECALGSVCEMYQPKTITGKELVPDGPYPVFGANGVIGRFTSYNHEEAEVLVTCRGATCGAINVSEPRSWVTGNAMVVRPLDGSLDKSFLEHMLRNGVDLSPAITGAAQPQITRTNLSPLMISFPKSVSEQRDLAAAFDDLKSASDSLHEISSRKITALDELKKSLLQQAFTGQLTAKSTDQRLEAVA